MTDPGREERSQRRSEDRPCCSRSSIAGWRARTSPSATASASCAAKDQIREAVKRAVDGRGIRDMEKGEDIASRRMSQSRVPPWPGGKREVVHPGNQDYVRGDRIERPKRRRRARAQQRPGQRFRRGRGRLRLPRCRRKSSCRSSSTDLACPNLVRTTLAETPEFKPPRRLLERRHAQQPARGALDARRDRPARIALGNEARRELHELEERLVETIKPPSRDRGPSRRDPAAAERDRSPSCAPRSSASPVLDPIDLRYRSRVRVPVPTSKAVMFCLMDVSGSMDEARKDLSKRFFILLYLFLTRHYEAHRSWSSSATTRRRRRSTRENFFHATETGGTVVSSALVLMDEIIRARYSPSSEWNIYGAQASDGDNWHHDSGRCRELLADKILPLCRYFAYVQVAEEEQNLWEEYAHGPADHAALRDAQGHRGRDRSTRCSATCSEGRGNA